MILVGVGVGECIGSVVEPVDRDRRAAVQLHETGYAIGTISDSSYPAERHISMSPEMFDALLKAMKQAKKERKNLERIERMHTCVWSYMADLRPDETGKGAAGVPPR